MFCFVYYALFTSLCFLSWLIVTNFSVNDIELTRDNKIYKSTSSLYSSYGRKDLFPYHSGFDQNWLYIQLTANNKWENMLGIFLLKKALVVYLKNETMIVWFGYYFLIMQEKDVNLEKYEFSMYF